MNIKTMGIKSVNDHTRRKNYKLLILLLAGFGAAFILLSLMIRNPEKKILMWVGLLLILACMIQVIMFNSKPELFDKKWPDPDEES